MKTTNKGGKNGKKTYTINHEERNDDVKLEEINPPHKQSKP